MYIRISYKVFKPLSPLRANIYIETLSQTSKNNLCKNINKNYR